MLKDDLRDQYKVKRVNKKVAPWNGSPPEKVHFGLPVTIRQINTYARQHNLHNRKFDHVHFNLPGVVEHLAEITDCPNLYYKIILSLDHDIVLAMYDNYTQRRLEFEPQDEKEVLEMIRRELGIEPEQEAMWCFSVNSEWYVGPIVLLRRNLHLTSCRILIPQIHARFKLVVFPSHNLSGFHFTHPSTPANIAGSFCMLSILGYSYAFTMLSFCILSVYLLFAHCCGFEEKKLIIGPQRHSSDCICS